MLLPNVETLTHQSSPFTHTNISCLRRNLFATSDICVCVRVFCGVCMNYYYIIDLTSAYSILYRNIEMQSNYAAMEWLKVFAIRILYLHVQYYRGNESRTILVDESKFI